MILYSPAKINLNLSVLGKRPDGFHELQTKMQAISLFDEIELNVSDADSFHCSETSLSNAQDNLAWKAVTLFRSKTSFHVPIRISLKKQIPFQAGLGGGSSNAATVLWGMNQLSGNLLSCDELVQMSGELGSDVPFFFSLGSALCKGRGEIVENITHKHESQVTIFKPKISLSTPRVFSFVNRYGLSNELHFNALEEAAFQAAPTLSNIKKKLLDSGFHTVTLCGSGSAFYCLGNGDSKGGYQVSFVQRTIKEWYHELIR